MYASADDLFVLERPSPTEGPSYLSDKKPRAHDLRVTRYATEPQSLFTDQQIALQGTWTGSFQNVSVARDEFGTTASNVVEADKLRLMRRLRMLKRLPDNHDGEGASAAIAASVDSALAFLWEVNTELRYGATLDDEGRAVFEFENRADGLFADVTFIGDPSGCVECYLRRVGEPSKFLTGELKSVEVKLFLQEAGVTA